MPSGKFNALFDVGRFDYSWFNLIFKDVTGNAALKFEHSKQSTGKARIKITGLTKTKNGNARLEIKDNKVEKTGKARLLKKQYFQLNNKTSDDFESYPLGSDGSPNWNAYWGDCEIVDENGNKVYKITGENDFIGASTNLNSNSATAIYSVKIKADATNPPDNYGLKIRMQFPNSNDNFYYIRILVDSKKIQITRKYGGNWTTLASVTDESLTTGTWYNLKIEAIDTKIRVYLNNIFKVEATSSTFREGYACVHSYILSGTGIAYFDDFNVDYYGKTGKAYISIPLFYKGGNARILKSFEKSKEGKARIKKTQSKTSDGKGRLAVYFEKSKEGKARVQAYSTKDKESKARIQITQQKSKTGTARILITEKIKTKDGNAYVNIGGWFVKTGKARISILPSKEKTSKARLQVPVTIQKTGIAEVLCVQPPILVSPFNLSNITDTTPELTFEIPTHSGNKKLHFWIQVDKVNTFDSGDLISHKSNENQTGWEYHNGTNWVAVPSDGVAPEYYGHKARYTIQNDEALNLGTYYWRVCATNTGFS